MQLHVRGNLDPFVEANGQLLIGGWAASAEPARLVDVQLEIGGRRPATGERVLNYESEDVRAHYPHLHGVERCRFFVRVPAARGADAFADRLLSCDTTFELPNGERTTPATLYALFRPRVPLPDDAAVESVGGGFHMCFTFLDHFRRLGGLQAGHDVLDVGCGVGRMAYPLAYFLERDSRYEGFDIMRKAIDWASSALTPQFPNVQFRHVDVFNKMYNANGALQSSSFEFPYDDASFDFLFLTSVFTHMFAPDVRHYLDEFRRVLRPGGRAFITCFLLNDETRALIAAGKGAQDLVHPLDEGYTTTPDLPEAAIGFDEEKFFGWTAERGFRRLLYEPGDWSGRSGGASYQDIVVLER